MKGGLEAYWNVYDWTSGNNSQAYARGMKPIALVDPFSSRANGKEGRITGSRDDRNPWAKPSFFESTIRADLQRVTRQGVPGVSTLVIDIEHEFEQDPLKAWNDPAVRTASGADNPDSFEQAYFKEWASWFALPAQWAKEMFPGIRVGFYGPQPFRRDYWGVSGKTAQQIDGTHANDAIMWQYIDPAVDFYVASLYLFYNNPDAVFYMASNVEENYLRTRRFGSKPVYAYQWMRYHPSGRAEANREVDPHQAEAMALVPYFSGAKGVVLWGHEPQLRGDTAGHAYQHLPVYFRHLGRVAALSEKIGRGKLILDPPAHQLWKTRQPLVRRIDVAEGECVVLALNPWQGENAESTAESICGGKPVRLQMKNRQATLAHIVDGRVEYH